MHGDDLLIFGFGSINETKKSLTLKFKMKDMNIVDTILGIRSVYILGVLYWVCPIMLK